MISVTRWKHFQHYGKSKPPWIKLYRDTLHDFETMNGLDPAERWVLVGLWMLAATHDNQIPPDCVYLSRTLNADVTPDLIRKLQTLGKIDVGDQSRQTLDESFTKAETEAEAEESSVDKSTGEIPDVDNFQKAEKLRERNRERTQDWGDFVAWFRAEGKDALWQGRNPPIDGVYSYKRDLSICTDLVKKEGVTIEELRALCEYPTDKGCTMLRYHGKDGRARRNEALGAISKSAEPFGNLSVHIGGA